MRKEEEEEKKTGTHKKKSNRGLLLMVACLDVMAPHSLILQWVLRSLISDRDDDDDGDVVTPIFHHTPCHVAHEPDRDSILE